MYNINAQNIPQLNDLQKYDQYNHCLVRYTGVVQDILETLYAAIAIKKQVEGNCTQLIRCMEKV